MHFYPYYQTLFAPESRFRSLGGTIFTYTNEQPAPSDFRQQIEARNFILILETEHNLIWDDFINQFYELYHPLTEIDNNRVKAIEQEFMHSPSVSDSLWAQAHRQNGSFDELLHRKAQALYDRTERKP